MVAHHRFKSENDASGGALLGARQPGSYDYSMPLLLLETVHVMTINQAFFRTRLLCLCCLIAGPMSIKAQTPASDGVQQQESGPELVAQSTPSMWGTGADSLFGPGGQWLATADNHGNILIYDLVGGRMSHRFDNVSGKALIAVHPARDWLAVLADNSLLMYDVNQGTVLWKQPVSRSCGALHFSADGSRLMGVCQLSDAPAEPTAPPPSSWSGRRKDTGVLIGWQTETGIEAKMPALAEGYEAGHIFSEDGRWVLGSTPLPDISGATPPSPGQKKQGMFKSLEQSRLYMKSLTNHVVLDTETGQVVGHLSAMIPMAISARTHSAIGMTTAYLNANFGTVVRSIAGIDPTKTSLPSLEIIDVINPSAKLIELQQPYGGAPQVSADGRYFLLPSPVGAARVDAASGAVENPVWGSHPAMTTAALAKDSDQVAFVLTGSIVLSRFSKPSESRLIGSAEMAALDADLQGMVTPQMHKISPLQTKKEVKARAREEMKELNAIKAPRPSIFHPREYQKKLEEYENETQAVERKYNNADEDTEQQSQQQVKQKMIAAMLKFGGPVYLPPMAAFLDSGRLLAVRSADWSWDLWDVATGNLIAVHKGKLGLDTALESKKPDETSKFAEALFDRGDLIEIEKSFGMTASSGPAPPWNKNADGLAVSPDGRLSFQYPIARSAPQYRAEKADETVGYGVRVSDAATHKALYDIPEILGDDSFFTLTPGGKVLVGADRAESLGFWDSKTGLRLATLYAYQEGEWLLTTPSGLFDGSPRGWQMIAWRDSSRGNATLSGEAFFSEFYRPGLLAEILEGHVPQPPRSIDRIDRRQPSVHISSSSVTTTDKTVTLHLSLTEATENGPPGGIRDVRLFRNGVLIHIWRNEIQLERGAASLDATVPLTAGENHFVAYAFNHDNVKSQDAELDVLCTIPAEPRTAYILAVGVNHYSNEEFDLNYAAPDAQHFSQTLLESLRSAGGFGKIVQVTLLDSGATKKNLLRSLDVLSGRTSTSELPQELTGLDHARPGDMVVLYFAGHGLAWNDHFYLIPHDIGFDGVRENLAGSLDEVLKHGVSDLELEKAFEGLDAASIMLVIDACNSGKALGAEDAWHGPMNTKGLAQLAYEKGMYVLTASQAFQAALESSRLGHGYLTYALVDEGLKTPQADNSPRDGNVSVVEWFEYAARRVPEMQSEALNQAPNAAGRKLSFESVPAPQNGVHESATEPPRLQTPRLYYRRDDRRGQATIVYSYPMP